MTEILEKPNHHIEREELQDRLAAIDRDPDKLRVFIDDLYLGHVENPHLIYAAATHLTSLSYLDRRDDADSPMLPSKLESTRAFTAYARLMAMLDQEKDAPRYANDERIRKRLAGAREELAFHGTLAYSTAQGADFVALPSPAKLDFNGAEKASDVQIFFPGSGQQPIEIQVTNDPAIKIANGRFYHPRIPVLSMSTALGSLEQASKVKLLLRSIGDRDDKRSGKVRLPKREHTILLDASASILLAAHAWQGE